MFYLKKKSFIWCDLAESADWSEQIIRSYGTTSSTVRGTTPAACPRCWPVLPAGTGPAWLTSTRCCTNGLLSPRSLHWSCSTQSITTETFIYVFFFYMYIFIYTVCLCVFRFADTEVRSVAVSWIEKSSDDELTDYLPQLVQVEYNIFIL